MNAPVEIKNNGTVRCGIFSGLDENGCLLLDQDGQIVRIEAGDVFPAGR
jgi:biotin-(acetyl-CoA carboxylase) ligase